MRKTTKAQAGRALLAIYSKAEMLSGLYPPYGKTYLTAQEANRIKDTARKAYQRLTR